MEWADSIILLIALYGIVGLFSGILAGMLGVGGGLIIVPVLAGLFRSQNIDESIIMHLAVGSSLATIVVTSIGSMQAHNKRGSVVWSIFASLSPGIVIGALLGAWLAGLFSTFLLQKIVALFIIIIGIQMISSFSVKAHKNNPTTLNMISSGSVIGLLSSMAGIGGGSLTVPYLMWHKVPMVKAIGTASACGLPIAMAGALGFVIVGMEHTSTTPMTTGFLYWPAIFGISIVSYFSTSIGVYLAHKVDVKTLKKLFSILLIFIGIYFFQS
ncbi:MAG: sulfite exporter TauE/SafE family protein [gamma proteobacterium symbiont of Taylorina sp.]|nr:sulfite exporter TauE/SafE family protein [gamma proteobacterium symbiont of Taylorina sp.]